MENTNLMVDAKVIVWDVEWDKRKLHFSHFDNDGKIRCFAAGTSSFTNEIGTTKWDHWQLAE